jgi:hypothetical protein
MKRALTTDASAPGPRSCHATCSLSNRALPTCVEIPRSTERRVKSTPGSEIPDRWRHVGQLVGFARDLAALLRRAVSLKA